MKYSFIYIISKFFVCILALSGLMICSLVESSTVYLARVTQLIQVNNISYNVLVPKGYNLQFIADNLNRPRIISFGKKSEMFIGSRSGNVYRLKPPYNKADVLIFLRNYPHSIVVRDDYIYIAQSNGIYRAKYQTGQNNINPKKLKLYVKLPAGAGHNSRTLRLGTDNNLYVSLGISGNCSKQYLDDSYPASARRGGVLVLNETEGKVKWETYASGLRNPIGFDWQPKTGIMYASNNGPDHWGFQIPKEYFSKLTKGSFHGMPWYQYVDNKFVRDNCISSKPPKSINKVKKPVVMFPARNAPMAVKFIRHGQLATHYKGDALVALHGSWAVPESGPNANKRSGRREPKIVIVHFKNGNANNVTDFISGFQLKNGTRWARPIGVAIADDGAVYFTSDSDSDSDNGGLFRLSKNASPNNN